jgi:ATP synthase protein I
VNGCFFANGKLIQDNIIRQQIIFQIPVPEQLLDISRAPCRAVVVTRYCLASHSADSVACCGVYKLCTRHLLGFLATQSESRKASGPRERLTSQCCTEGNYQVFVYSFMLIIKWPIFRVAFLFLSEYLDHPSTRGLNCVQAQAGDLQKQESPNNLCSCNRFNLRLFSRREIMAKIGKYAFIIGLVIAVAAAFLLQVTWVMWVLAVLGLVVGYLNVTKEETRSFLLAAIGLMLAATSVQVLPLVGDLITRIMSNLVVFIAPAVLVVALKSLFETAKD